MPGSLGSIRLRPTPDAHVQVTSFTMRRGQSVEAVNLECAEEIYSLFLIYTPKTLQRLCTGRRGRARHHAMERLRVPQPRGVM